MLEPSSRFIHRGLSRSLRDDRTPAGIDLNVQEQLDLLGGFHYNEELLPFTLDGRSELEFCYRYDFFSAGDSRLAGRAQWGMPFGDRRRGCHEDIGDNSLL